MHERELTLAGLRTVVIGNEAEARAVVVVLHGFAMQPSDLSPFAHSLGVPALFLFPEGPLRAEFTPGTFKGNTWWPIDPLRRGASLANGPRDFHGEHPQGLAAARTTLLDFLAAVRPLDARLGSLPLVLCGFSQGGMLACDTFLRHELGLAGLVLLSASRIAFDEWQPLLRTKASAGAFPPLLISHGESDDDLAFSAGVALRDCLAEAGAEPSFVSFSEGHLIPVVVWRALRKFLLRIIAQSTTQTGK